jgi:hypothetical protein
VSNNGGFKQAFADLFGDSYGNPFDDVMPDELGNPTGTLNPKDERTRVRLKLYRKLIELLKVMKRMSELRGDDSDET